MTNMDSESSEPIPQSTQISVRPLAWITGRNWALLGVAILIAVITLRFMGRPWWCQAGDLAPWSGDTFSRHNSQHFWDPYTFTHILHGVLFYGFLWLLLRRWSHAGCWATPGLRFALALCLESSWEVLENTNWIIEKYRTDTISLNYFGDSVLNSLSDILSAATGFLIARRLPVLGSITFFFLTELILVVTIRDNLMINIVMLIYPIEALKNWMGGG